MYAQILHLLRQVGRSRILRSSALVCGALLLALRLSPPTAQMASVASQPWQNQPRNSCAALQGAVFALPTLGCGGGTTTFDTKQIYSPAVLADTASSAAPCPGVAAGSPCYRLWYVGEDASGTPRIGYAVAPDAKSWTRVVGAGSGGSVLDLGANTQLDSRGVSYLSVMKDGATFKMWYSGYGQAFGTDQAEGIGYATSTDGQTWTRIAGPLAGGAVLRASGVAGTFDQDEVYVPFVLKDQASSAAPCAGVAAGATCYRLWYEGATNAGGYRFRIGYATSPDGVSWTRVAGGAPNKEALGVGAFGAFDDNSVGIAAVIKDGALYRMWYEAKDFASGAFTIGHVTATDGQNWVRSTPNEAVYRGSNDPATSFTPDDVWSHSVLKDGATYHMWYTVSTRPQAQRLGYATMTPGTPFAADALALTGSGTTYTLSFTTTATLPAGGSVLISLPPALPFAQVSAGVLSGFAAGATLSGDPAAVSDAAALNTTRGALLVRLASAEPPGVKRVQFSLASAPAALDLLVQTFDTQEVQFYGTVTLASGTVAPTNTPVTPTSPNSTPTPLTPTSPNSTPTPLTPTSPNSTPTPLTPTSPNSTPTPLTPTSPNSTPTPLTPTSPNSTPTPVTPVTPTSPNSTPTPVTPLPNPVLPSVVSRVYLPLLARTP